MDTVTPAAERSEHGLKRDAIGFIDGLIIGIASTAPAYSLAAVLAIVVVTVGVQAPAVLLASFVPMFLIASAFYYMNRADPDCGTTFSWVTRALGAGARLGRRLGPLHHRDHRDRLARGRGRVLHLRHPRPRRPARLQGRRHDLRDRDHRRDDARQGGVEVELVVSPERPAEGLHKLAAERGARFIVVGSHGEGAVAGSVPHRLLQIAGTPVVVVRG